MNKLSQEIVNTILENKDEAFKKLSMESFDVYSFLNKEFKNTKDITKNYLFQFLFRSFYRLDNAGLTSELKTRYFELLQEYRNKPIDLKVICLDLNNYKTKKGLNSIQFSFATKLANTIDENYPIYDSEVIRLFNFKQPYSLKDKDEKIDKYLLQYKYIVEISQELVCNSYIKDIFKEMDLIFGSNCIEQGNIKKLDTLMWAIGKVIDQCTNRDM